MKKTLLLSALVVSFSALSAFSAVKNPDTIISATIGDTDSLDPAWSYDTASHHIIANCYEYLLAFKTGSITELVPMLASAVPSRANKGVSSDGLTYTFPIRKGVKFHSGKVLTPEDVRYSLLRFMLSDRDGGPSSLLLEPILGVVATRGADGKMTPGLVKKAFAAVTVKGDAVVIRLHKPFAPFLSILASFGGIVEKDFTAAQGGWDGTEATAEKFNNPAKRDDMALHEKVNGTGPYRLERRDHRLKEIVLIRHDGYWRGPARLKRAIVKVMDEFNTRKLMLQAGDADEIYAPQSMFTQVAGLDGVTVVDGLENLECPTAIQFTFKINPVGNSNIGSGKLDGDGIPTDFFTDKDMRKAIAHSLDYDGYIKDVQRGKGKRAYGFIPKGMLGYLPEGPMPAYDLKKAEEHFRKAWKGQVWEKGFKFTFLFNSGSQGMQILANMLKKNVESLNPKFKIDVRPLQWSSYLSETQQHKVPVEGAAWLADYPDPHNFAFPLAHSQGYYSSKSLYANPKADKLVAAGLAELDPKKREKIYFQLQDLINEEMPFINISVGTRYRTQRSWIKGWIFSPVFPGSPYDSYYYDLYKAE